MKEIEVLQLASATCQRVCRMLGCCKLDAGLCIVMSIYTTSVTKRLEQVKGNSAHCLSTHNVFDTCCAMLYALADPINVLPIS